MYPPPSCHLRASGVVMESKASSTDHHATVTSTGSSGGEDLHRQVRNYTYFKKIRSKWIIWRFSFFVKWYYIFQRLRLPLFYWLHYVLIKGTLCLACSVTVTLAAHTNKPVVVQFTSKENYFCCCWEDKRNHWPLCWVFGLTTVKPLDGITNLQVITGRFALWCVFDIFRID